MVLHLNGAHLCVRLNLCAKSVKTKLLKRVLNSKFNMELKILEENKTKLKFEVIGEDHTFCNFIRKELWNDEDIKAAGYEIEHNLVGEPVFIIEMNKEDPKKSLLKAVERLELRNKDIRSTLKKVLK